MPRYDRIPARIESPRENSTTGDVAEENTPRRNKKQQLKRRGSLNHSHNSESYDSVGNNEQQDFLYNDHGENDDKDENNKKLNSPFRSQKSYASDHEDGENDLPSDTASFPVSPRSLPSLTARFSDSFDLDDDDDDYIVEANLKRYNLDFATTERGTSVSEDGYSRGSSNKITKVARFLWHSFQSVRQQARQRRAQLLLQQTERNWKQSLKICVLTNCDATDSGILLVAASIVIWIVLLILVEGFRTMGILLGISLFVIRVGTRPLYHCLRRQRQKRRMWHQQLENGNGEEHDHYDENLEMHAIHGNDIRPNRQPATSVGSDPTIAAI